MNIDHYAVIGNPISHSKSPYIHSHFAEQSGQNMDYVRLLAPLDGFKSSVYDFRAAGGKGMNVTVPFKLEAYALASRLTPRAQRAGAVNTLIFHADGSIEGDNTDGIGLVRDLRYHGVKMQDANILLLGAGGAVRGVLAPLLAEQPARIVIANRSADKAIQLAQDFADLGASVQGCGYPDLQGQRFDVIINGTSASLSGELPPLPDHLLKHDGVTYDMAYGKEPTPFQRWGQTHGASQTLDGLGMLLEQAAESFHLWRGVVPQTPLLRAWMRQGNAE